jgi:hypothetical protein
MSLKLGERVVAAIVVFGALLFAMGSVTFWSSDRYACPVPSTGNFWKDTANPAECRLLRRFPEIVRRSEKQLVVTLASGQSKLFADEGVCWEDPPCSFYVLGAISPDRDVLGFWWGAAEGNDAMLFDRRSGAEIQIEDLPEMSEDGKYWLAIDHSAIDGSGLAQLIRHESGAFKTIAEGDAELCDFERWDVAPAFLALCFVGSYEKRKELRFTPDSIGGLVRTETGRVLTPEEENPYD